MSNLVKIIECPRDAWQGLPFQISAEVKADYMRALIAAGFQHLDAVSFVSPSAVPQMADSEKVLEYVQAPGGTEIIGIVVNEKGAERAIDTNAVHTLGFPYSISPEFLKRNQNQTLEEAVEMLEAVATKAYDARLELVVYISMAFGNPYGDAWSVDEVVDACSLLTDLGVTQISLADTVGMATAAQISETVEGVLAEYGDTEIGVHLHSRSEEAPARIRAAYEAGCRRFDSAMGGMGGCPFAQDILVGNIATETLIETLQSLGAEMPQFTPLDGLIHANAEITRKYGTRKQ